MKENNAEVCKGGNGMQSGLMANERGTRGCERGEFYTIQPGDTLEKIATSHQITVRDLIYYNPYLNPNNYVIGQVIILPKDKLDQMTQTNEVLYYEIEKNDSIGEVLRKFQMSIREFEQLNRGVDVFLLKEGDLVTVKQKRYPMVQGKIYQIGKGENIYDISKKFGVSVVELLKANPNLRPLEFSSGISIAIPHVSL